MSYAARPTSASEQVLLSTAACQCPKDSAPSPTCGLGVQHQMAVRAIYNTCATSEVRSAERLACSQNDPKGQGVQRLPWHSAAFEPVHLRCSEGHKHARYTPQADTRRSRKNSAAALNASAAAAATAGSLSSPFIVHACAYSGNCL